MFCMSRDSWTYLIVHQVVHVLIVFCVTGLPDRICEECDECTWSEAGSPERMIRRQGASIEGLLKQSCKRRAP
jgi:hypothetical protein